MIDQIVDAYAAASTRLLVFDYDGVLTPIIDHPELAQPTEEVRDMLRELSGQPGTKPVVVSGRDQVTLERWLGDLSIDMSAEHGHFSRYAGSWHANTSVDMPWRADVESLMEQLAVEYPESQIELKQASVIWHYRRVSDPLDEHAIEQRFARVVRDRAIIMAGKRAIDVRAFGADKGRAVRHWYDEQGWDFVLCMGDDVTDESMFATLPEPVWTVRVGGGETVARHQLADQADVITLLRRLASS